MDIANVSSKTRKRLTVLFPNLGDTVETKRNHAGFLLESRRAGEPPIWYVLDKVFEEEICKGKDLRLVCHVLADCGWLKKDGRNIKAKVPKSLTGENLLPPNTRLYCFKGIAPPEENGAGTEGLTG